MDRWRHVARSTQPIDVIDVERRSVVVLLALAVLSLSGCGADARSTEPASGDRAGPGQSSSLAESSPTEPDDGSAPRVTPASPVPVREWPIATQVLLRQAGITDLRTLLLRPGTPVAAGRAPAPTARYGLHACRAERVPLPHPVPIGGGQMHDRLWRLQVQAERLPLTASPAVLWIGDRPVDRLVPVAERRAWVALSLDPALDPTAAAWGVGYGRAPPRERLPAPPQSLTSP